MKEANMPIIYLQWKHVCILITWDLVKKQILQAIFYLVNLF